MAKSRSSPRASWLVHATCTAQPQKILQAGPLFRGGDAQEDEHRLDARRSRCGPSCAEDQQRSCQPPAQSANNRWSGQFDDELRKPVSNPHCQSSLLASAAAAFRESWLLEDTSVGLLGFKNGGHTACSKTPQSAGRAPSNQATCLRGLVPARVCSCTRSTAQREGSQLGSCMPHRTEVKPTIPLTRLFSTKRLASRPICGAQMSCASILDISHSHRSGAIPQTRYHALVFVSATWQTSNGGPRTNLSFAMNSPGSRRRSDFAQHRRFGVPCGRYMPRPAGPGKAAWRRREGGMCGEAFGTESKVKRAIAKVTSPIPAGPLHDPGLGSPV